MHMPIMDHRIVANLEPCERAWIVDRAFSILSEDSDLDLLRDNVSLNGLAHTYNERLAGLNTMVTRCSSGRYAIRYYPPDRKGYIPFFVSVDQVTGVSPVKLEVEDSQVGETETSNH